MSNASGCSTFEAPRATAMQSIEPETQKFFHQRHELSSFTVATSDGEQTLRNACGAFMGGSPAAVFFARTFRVPIQ
eukprot:9018140-Pyramimonas_sp.AAC.1